MDNYIEDARENRVVKNVTNLVKKQHVNKPSRTESTLEVSEFNLVKSGTGNKGFIRLNDLTNSLKQRSKHIDVGKQIQNAERKGKTLQKPLEKFQTERIRRNVAYGKVTKHLDEWEAIVTSNRAASSLSFPLNYETKLADEKLEKDHFRLKTDLQKKLEELEPKVEIYNVDMELEKKHPLNVAELLEKRREAAKLRAHQSYKEAKARRQSKIKSKKYHRIQRKEKIKQKMKEFELLQKTNPEAALLKLEEIEKARAEERASLRHKSTGQWARSKQVRAKYDKESRQVLAQQLAISRDLTQKLKKDESDSEEEVSPAANVEMKDPTDSSNPWTNIKTTKEVDDFISGYRKFWEDNNKNTACVTAPENELEHVDVSDERSDMPLTKKKLSNLKTGNKINNSDSCVKNPIRTTRIDSSNKMKKLRKPDSTSEWSVEDIHNDREAQNVEEKSSEEKLENIRSIDKLLLNTELKIQEKLKQKYEKITKDLKQTNIKSEMKKSPNQKGKKIALDLYKAPNRPIIDECLLENGAMDPENIVKHKLNTKADDRTLVKPTEEKNIGMKKMINPQIINLPTTLPDLYTDKDNEEVAQLGVIQDAFEDENVVEDFKKEKEEDIKKDQSKDIDLNLPGWGSWGGTDIKESKRKRKRFIIHFPKKIPRRDDNKGDLIINETNDMQMRTHLVSDVPFPFTTVKDYEASIRAPIGNTFVPETAFKKLVRPGVITKMGTIIEPMPTDILLKKIK